jgi:hypothetical protein
VIGVAITGTPQVNVVPISSSLPLSDFSSWTVNFAKTVGTGSNVNVTVTPICINAGS